MDSSSPLDLPPIDPMSFLSGYESTLPLLDEYGLPENGSTLQLPDPLPPPSSVPSVVIYPSTFEDEVYIIRLQEWPVHREVSCCLDSERVSVKLPLNVKVPSHIWLRIIANGGTPNGTWYRLFLQDGASHARPYFYGTDVASFADLLVSARKEKDLTITMFFSNEKNYWFQAPVGGFVNPLTPLSKSPQPPQSRKRKGTPEPAVSSTNTNTPTPPTPTVSTTDPNMFRVALENTPIVKRIKINASMCIDLVPLLSILQTEEDKSFIMAIINWVETFPSVCYFLMKDMFESHLYRRLMEFNTLSSRTRSMARSLLRTLIHFFQETQRYPESHFFRQRTHAMYANPRMKILGEKVL